MKAFAYERDAGKPLPMPARPRAPVVLLLAAGALAACADLPFRQPGERSAELPPGKGLIVFTADGVGERPARRIQYSDNEQRVDYALYQGGGAQAEFIYMERPAMLRVVFNFPFTIADKVAAWNFSKGQPVEYGKAVPTRTKLGEIFYRPYGLTAMNRRCFGVSGEWDRAPDDPQLRHTRILFGYYCAAPGQALGDDRAKALVDTIGLRGVTERAEGVDSFYNFHADVAGNHGGPEGTRKAIEVAQGGAGAAGGAGIAEFPFRYAERYQQSGADDFGR